jgi:hypothetical protein
MDKRRSPADNRYRPVSKQVRKRKPTTKARKRLTPEQRAYWRAQGCLDFVPEKVIVEFERQLDDYIAWYSAGLRKALAEPTSATKSVVTTRGTKAERDRAALRAFDRAMGVKRRTSRRS